MNCFEHEYDVVVAGGGIAGVAAALEAARAGLKTALVEKTVFWGGLAITGLVNIYLPLCGWSQPNTPSNKTMGRN